ncbi:putative U3 small nucleolar RNA-associated protein 13 [Wickerhamiella sorbophila]|uniref:Putative U3 small nucleolar RNA-associated protein 13 n=1 Tax=Wickerhamiella sorbophila TaxID=45607 RepID=A0A2T0FME3_9ASCO|nr:putative U3 small nucleolar RNA-associated protein 13 [Wickerhamiella sorbophila]PRT56150.1 putative U3 small nucleolar RNA-associated protein 13 [Wickerhamiella sorbophila]
MLFKAATTAGPIYLGGAVSAVDNYLATSSDTKVIVSDLASGAIIHNIEGDGEQLTAVKITPDKSLLITASRSLQIHIYSLESGKLVKTFHKAHESHIMTLEVDPTSTLLASGGAEGAVKVWDISGGFVTHNLRGHGGIITCLKFYGKLGGSDWRLASGSDDTKVRVWDLVKSKCIKVLENHMDVIRGLAFNSTGEILLTAGRDKVVSIWKNLELAGTLAVLDEVEAVGFTASGIYTAVTRGLKLWSLSTEMTAEWNLSHDESAVTDAVRIDASHLLVVLSDQTLVDIQLGDGKSIEVSRFIGGNHGEIIDLAPARSMLAVATNSQDVRLVSLDNPLEFQPLVGHTDIVLAVDVLGQWLVSAGKDKMARLWDLKTGECKIVFSGHAGAVGAVAISRVGKVPDFVITGSQDLTIKKWDASGNAEYTRKAHDKDINSLDVSSNNSLFVTGSQDRTAKVWSVETGEVLGVLRGHRRGIWNVKFGPENTVVTASGDKTVRQWSLHDYTCLRTFEGHLNSVLKVVIYGDYIASAGGDGLVKVWDPKTNEAVSTLDNHEEKVWSLTVVDGQLVSGGGDGVITVWQDYTEEEQARQEQEREDQIEKQQELENSVRSEEWDRAIALALELNHPFRLLKLFTEVANHQEAGSVTGLNDVDDVLAELDDARLYKLLERLRDWNTNGRTSIIAQTVLHSILRRKGPQELSQSKYLAIFRQIAPYTQRHLNRNEELLESSYAVDYALKEMSGHL